MNHVPKKRRFNLIDALILIGILAAVLFAVDYAVNDMSDSRTLELDCTLRISGIADTDANKLEKGKALFVGDTAAALGKIRKLRVTERKEAVFDEESDRFVFASVPGESIIYVTVRTRASVKNDRYYFGETLLCANTDIELLLPFPYEKAEIVSVRESEPVLNGLTAVTP